MTKLCNSVAYTVIVENTPVTGWYSSDLPLFTLFIPEEYSIRVIVSNSMSVFTRLAEMQVFFVVLGRFVQDLVSSPSFSETSLLFSPDLSQIVSQNERF